MNSSKLSRETWLARAMVDEVRADDHRLEAEHVCVAWIDVDLDPVRGFGAEPLEPGEVLDSPLAGRRSPAAMGPRVKGRERKDREQARDAREIRNGGHPPNGDLGPASRGVNGLVGRIWRFDDPGRMYREG